MQKDITELQKDGWLIEYGKAGGGSCADRNSTPAKIVIDGSEKGNSAADMQSLAHEVGHATYPYRPDYSSIASFLDGALSDEGVATKNNTKV